MAGSAGSLSPGWLGADVEQLDQVATRCGQAGEAAGQVARSLRAEVLEQEWASGPFFRAYREFVASHLVPTLTMLAEALHRFRKVVSAQADAQRRVSAGEPADLAAIPQYTSPLSARSSRGKAPPSVDLPPGSELFGPLWKPEGGHTQQVGPASSTTDWQVRAVGLDGDPGFLSTGDPNDKASVRAYLLDYSHVERGKVGPAEVAVDRTASVSAGLSVGGSINLDSWETFHVRGEAEAFAGARAGVEGRFEVGGLSAAGSAEGWAGAGLARGGKLGWQDDGSFAGGFTIGGAFGLGGKVSWSIAVNPTEVRETISQAVETVGEIADQAGDWLSSGWDTKPGSR